MQSCVKRQSLREKARMRMNTQNFVKLVTFHAILCKREEHFHLGEDEPTSKYGPPEYKCRHYNELLNANFRACGASFAEITHLAPSFPKNRKWTRLISLPPWW